jgi:photosystem II stability/assembly factor-like uncharacterized protein
MYKSFQIFFFFFLFTQIGFPQWYWQNSPTTQNLNAVHFIDVNNGFAVGDSGIIIHTTDGGVNWTIIPSGTTVSLKGICFTNTNNGYIVGDIDGWGIILRTTTGGETWWQSTTVGEWTGIPGGLHAVCSIDSSNLWVVGWTSGIEGYAFNYILKTTDGGINWIELGYYAGFVRGGYLNDVFFIDDSTGFAIGEFYPDGGNIIKTTDGGNNWMELHSSGEVSFNGVFGVSASTWFVVGESDTYGGIVMRTSDGGNSWDWYHPLVTTLYGVHFTDFNNGTVVGKISVIGGMCIPSIDKTTNGGVSWNKQDWIFVGEGCLVDVIYVDSLNGWTVGGNGTILHTTNGGLTFAEEDKLDEVPTEFLLSQNYPNPFNPSTKISWQSPVSSRQVLKVYDVLGNEIAALVDEEKEAGYHSIDFSASELPSGVYFYQLKAGDFIQTKKMLLLK